MKKFARILALCVVIISVITSTFVYAGNEIKVTLNGIPIKFDVAPQMINNRTMVPLRAIFEALGAKVDWNDNTQTVVAKKDDTTVSATIGKKTMYINGKSKTMDVAPMLLNSRTLVPVRFVAEAFDCDVDWDEDNNLVSIYSVFDNNEPLLPDSIISEQEE